MEKDVVTTQLTHPTPALAFGAADGKAADARKAKAQSQNRARCAVTGLLIAALTVLGLLATNLALGPGMVAFSFFGPLWVLFGAGVAVDCFLAGNRGAR